MQQISLCCVEFLWASIKVSDKASLIPVSSTTETWFICSRRWCMNKLWVFIQTKHLFVFIPIWTKDKVGVTWNRFKPSSKIFNWPFQGSNSFVDHLCYLCLVFVMFSRVCSLLPCDYLLGKGWPLGSWLWCLLWFYYFPIWYPRTGVVLDCIDSWPLPSFLLF